jgi:hypothetical protein
MLQKNVIGRLQGMTIEPMDPELVSGLKARLQVLTSKKAEAKRTRADLDRHINELADEIQKLKLIVGEPLPPSETTKRVTLMELHPKPRDRAPSLLSLPTGETRPLGQWNRLLIEVALYLDERGKIDSLPLPLRMRGAMRHLVSRSNVHPNGRDFFLPYHLREGKWLETHASAVNLVSQARFLVVACGENPSTFQVEF